MHLDFLDNKMENAFESHRPIISSLMGFTSTLGCGCWGRAGAGGDGTAVRTAEEVKSGAANPLLPLLLLLVVVTIAPAGLTVTLFCRSRIQIRFWEATIIHHSSGASNSLVPKIQPQPAAMMNSILLLFCDKKFSSKCELGCKLNLNDVHNFMLHELL